MLLWARPSIGATRPDLNRLFVDTAPNIYSVVFKLRVATPGAPAGHTNLDDATNEARIRDAARLFAAAGLGPARLAEGADWSIEQCAVRLIASVSACLFVCVHLFARFW